MSEQLLCNIPKGHCRYYLTLLERGNPVATRKTDNIVLLLGRQKQADILFGLDRQTTFQYVALGSATNTPLNTDASLYNEIVRKKFTSISRSGLVVTCSVTLSTTEGNGVLSEIGNVSSGSMGTFYNRATFIPLAKTNTQDLLIVVKFLA